MNEHPNDPLYGKTLAHILEYLFGVYGWEGLYESVPVNCFKKDPTIKSSLTFLRKTPWARVKIEELYLETKAAEKRRKE